MLINMQERIRKARADQRGFTLIELLIVIVILGVLAGIVVFAVSAFNNDGKASACKADVKSVEIAEEAWYAKHNPHAYTTTLQDLVDNGYLKEVPDTANYTITVAADGTVSSSPAGCSF
jgi:prepilin-type N-terminal cleavage/methylation domain-containing protein